MAHGRIWVQEFGMAPRKVGLSFLEALNGTTTTLVWHDSWVAGFVEGSYCGYGQSWAFPKIPYA